MQIQLSPGELIDVTFEGTDGVITVKFDFEGDQKVSVEADLPDSSGREGVIYMEDFSGTVCR